MNTVALAMLQTRGLVALIKGTDAMLKTAKVYVVGIEKTGQGVVTVLLRGSVGDCIAAVDAGVSAANSAGELLGASVIPYPYRDLEVRLPIGPVK